MRSNLARIFAVVMGVSLSLTILAACGAGTTTGSGTPTAGSTVIKIATDLPVSGKVVGGGKPIEDSVHLAVNAANANPCLTKNTPGSGCSGANDLLPRLRPTGKLTYFRVATTDDHQGPAGADHLYKTLGYRKAYIIDDAEIYGIGIATTFAAEWKNLGGTVLGHSSEPSTTTSYVPLLTQATALHPDVIYFGGESSTGGTLIRQQMEQEPALANTPFGGRDGIVTHHVAQTIGLKGSPISGTVSVGDTTS